MEILKKCHLLRILCILFYFSFDHVNSLKNSNYTNTDIQKDSSTDIPENLQLNSTFKKCCPIGESPISRNHPELCQKSNWTYFQDNFNFSIHISPLNCVQIGKKFGSGIQLEFESLNEFIAEVSNQNFCIDEILPTGELYLFNCSTHWAYGEFLEPVGDRFGHVFLTISTFFLLISVFLLALQLPEHRGNETFLLKFFLVLSVFLYFLIIFINSYIHVRPEDYCTAPYYINFLLYDSISFSTVSWGTILSINLLLAFCSKMIIYSIIGWGFPFILRPTCFFLVLAFWPTKYHCVQYKIDPLTPFFWSALFLTRFVCFFVTFILILKHYFQTKFSRENDQKEFSKEFKKMFHWFLKLFYINGLIWVGVLLFYFLSTQEGRQKSNPWDNPNPGISKWIQFFYQILLGCDGIFYFFFFAWNKKTKKFLNLYTQKPSVSSTNT